MQTSLMPPTLNLHNISENCQGVDLVPLKAKEKKIRTDLGFRKTDLVKKVFGYADEQLKAKGMKYQ